MPPPSHPNQDQSFIPEMIPAHNQKLIIAGISLRVLHTPGHASNHLCFLHETEKILFTGDHVMQGSTVVINPPDGDMSVYLSCLRMLIAEPIDYFAPGHGFLIGQPVQAIERLLLHRQDRENKILSAMRLAQEPLTVETLVSRVYQDTPVQRHALAARSLLAHLYKLKKESRVTEHAEHWCLTQV